MTTSSTSTPTDAATRSEASGDDLKTLWTRYQRENPDVRIRSAAADLGVSEVELLATGCGEHVTRLEGSWRALLQKLESLGPVMALTRNDAAVHEKTGVYRNVRLPEDSHVGLVLDDAIDLRLFLDHWHAGFAVAQETKAGTRHAIQFFDRDGTAVHKVYLTRKSDRDAYERLVEAHRSDDQTPHQAVEPRGAPAPADDPADDDVDAEAFLSDWSALKDTHDFFPLLREYGLDRTQALRLAEGRFTEPAPATSVRAALQAAAQDDVPIMVFVGNRGCLQIHTGAVRTLKETGPWFNVLDPGFQLHLNEAQIDAAWIVRKPTSDGVVTSVEVYDADGWPIARLFGKRKPGQPELDAWRDVVDVLPRA